MNTIDITVLFVRHEFKLFDISSWLSLIIRIVTRFKYNHVAIRYSDGAFVYIVEARSGGVIKATVANWLKHRPDKNWEEGKKLYIDNDLINYKLGLKYDIPSLFSQLIYQYTGIWIGSTSSNEENCSEFVADIIKINKPYLATAKSLYKLLHN